MRFMIWSLLLPIVAEAGEIEAWKVSDFGDGIELGGVDGWDNGYPGDSWGAWDGYAYAISDDSADSSQGYGNDTALDNWLIRGAAVNDGATTFRFYNYDDDTAGIVFKFSAQKQFYMLAHYEDDAPYPLQAASGPTLAIVRVQSGQGAVIASVQKDSLRFGEETVDVRVEYNDGDIRVLWNDQEVIEVTDEDPLPAGKSGLYAYNNGYNDQRRETVWYESIRVSYWDEDDDGIADDEDNCENDANGDQSDTDGDGIGDVCDESSGGGGGDDDDTGNPPGGDDGTPEDGVTGAGSCGCTTGLAATSSFWWLLLPSALLWFRSRR